MKHLKTFEGFFGNLFGKSEKRKPETTHYWGNYTKNELESLGFTYIPRPDSSDEKSDEKSGYMGIFKYGDKDIYITNKSVGRQGLEDNYYEIIVDGYLEKKCNTITDIKKWIKKNT